MNSKTFYDAWNDKSYAVDQAGKGFTLDSPYTVSGSNRTTIGVTPRGYSVSSALTAVRKDETLYSAIVTKVDATVGNGWYLSSSNKQQQEKAERFLEQAKFSSVLRHMLFNLYPFGNAFIEIVEGKPELYVLETTEMEIEDKDGHGEPSLYVQNNGSNKVEFSPENIVHFRLDRFTTSLWGEIPIRPLDQYIGIKMAVKSHIWRLFRNNSFRTTILFPVNTVDEDVNRSLAEYKLSMKDPNRPFAWFGGVDQKALMNYEDGPRFIETINAADKAILVQMQVPPIMAGVPDNSGRASGEQQTYKAFNTHIKSIQKSCIEDTINNVLLPRLGFPAVTFHFNELDNKSEKDILEMAVHLKALGAKPDKLANWMVEQGIDVDDDFFNPDFYESPSKNDKNAMTNKTSGSRKGKNGERSNVGTGSGSSTREDQIVTQSLEDDEVELAFERLTNPVIKKRAKELYEKGFTL